MTRTTRRFRRIYEDLARGIFPIENDRTFLMAQANHSLPDDQALLLLEIFELLRDPTLAPLIEPYLQRSDAPALAQEALWALCQAGIAAEYKEYILQAVNPGFDWDLDRDVRVSALYGAGEYLHHHQDPDFAHMIAELIDRNDDPVLRSLDEDDKVNTAEMAAGLAMGGDPAELALRDDDNVLRRALVARFLAERRDG